ncbi:hypothetical protein BFN03_17850 [Rhodococcus sp. WMMA185]|uniref:hypothetical protein n=1 Tax=Rhodococcus sp. WMMA185 TaxID=679318 RepID=UPI00087810CF|nr:hypothetical protein [Rhodococcus sp. WMMA185]AOW93894.1 hypothetical protein BFN03_17850 [Rhodococcus sp. WMMA185]
MSARLVRRIAAVTIPIAAATVMSAGNASADPPHPFGGPALTIGCPNQGSLASLTNLTGQSGPEASPPIAKGDIRFESFPAAPPIPAAAQVTVAWLNTDTGQSGIVDLAGVYPNLSATVNTGEGNVIATGFGSINIGSSPICQANPAIGTFIA